MKYNLIFGGIKSEGAIENTENVVKKFLVDELLIPEAEVSEFKFQNVHRLVFQVCHSKHLTDLIWIICH
jgi:hypothetical protein